MDIVPPQRKKTIRFWEKENTPKKKMTAVHTYK